MTSQIDRTNSPKADNQKGTLRLAVHGKIALKHVEHLGGGEISCGQITQKQNNNKEKMMVSYVNKHNFIVAINHGQEKDHHHFHN